MPARTSTTPSLWWDAKESALHCEGAVWDRHAHDWKASPRQADEGLPVTPREAIRLLQKQNPMRGLPMGVIGPKKASPEIVAVAEAVGVAIAGLGLPLLCGGKSGVMEAACKGAKSAGGLTIGLLPDEEWSAANPYVDIPLASGIGPARNAIIARACPVLVAIGGEYGTLTEMAFGLHFNRHVIAICNAPPVAGVTIANESRGRHSPGLPGLSAAAAVRGVHAMRRAGVWKPEAVCHITSALS